MTLAKLSYTAFMTPLRARCALIAAICIAAFLVPSSAWAGHGLTNPDVVAGQIIRDSVHNTEITDSAVESSEIAIGAVCGSATGCSGRDHIVDGSISSADIATDSIVVGDLSPGVRAMLGGTPPANSITEAELGTGVVCGSGAAATVDCDGAGGMETHIKAGTIGTADISADAMTALQTDATARTAAGDAATAAAQAAVVAVAAQADANTAQADADTAQADAATAQMAAVAAQAAADAAQMDATAAAMAAADVQTNLGTETTARTTAIAAEADARTMAIGTAIGTETTARTMAIAAETMERTTAIGTAIAAETMERTTAIGTAIAAETMERTTAIGTAIAAETMERTTAIGTAIGTETMERTTAIGTAIAAETMERTTAIGTETNARTAADRRFDTRITGISSQVDGVNDSLSRLDSRLTSEVDRLDEGIAMAGALSMMRIPAGKSFGISIGVGSYEDKQAMSLGIGFQLTDEVLFSVGGSYGFDSEKVLAAGSLSIGF